MGGIFGSGQSINTTEPMALGLRIQTSAYGLVVPILYGRSRIAGNLIWYSDFTAVPHTTTTSSGGGKGGGSVDSTNTTYTYTAALALGLCEGQISGINAFWSDKDYITDAGSKFSKFLGSYPQSVWTWIATNHSDSALAYEGLSYVAASAYDLGNNSSLPNHTFDVSGRLQFNSGVIDDANPKDIVVDFLTNGHYGVGFPAIKIGDLTQYSNYCVSNNLFLSPAYTTQKRANEILTDLCRITNSGIYFSEGKLKITPFGDSYSLGNGVAYTPNVMPIYALNDDDFIVTAGEDPVRLLRNATSDAFNSVQVEFVNRFNEYNIEIAEAKDQVNIDSLGLRPMQPITAHEIALPSVARSVAQLLLQRSCYIRNTYEFTLSWKYCLLEPTDYVTITDTALGLNSYPIRILSVEENEDGLLTIIAEDAPSGVSSHAVYSQQSSEANSFYTNASASDTNAPVIFEAPAILTSNGLEVWIGACGGTLWGGCQVWVSIDGVNYQQIATITNPARMGWLNSPLVSHADPDKGDTLSIDLSISRATLDGGSQADADNFTTLAYVDGEYISYQNSTLVGANKYNLSYLRRGVYHSNISTHAANSPFIRIDDKALAKYAFTPDKIGNKIYIKLPSFNQYGAAVQSIADIEAIIYTIQGSALTSALPNVQNVTSNFVGNVLNLYWDAIKDFRQPNVDYEIRVGNTWETASVFGRTSLASFTAICNGTHWIAAHYQTSSGINIYSTVPVAIQVSGATLVRNVIASFNESNLGWLGSRTNMAVANNNLYLGASGNILGEPNVLSITDVIWFGGVCISGEYDLPASHLVNIGRVAPCIVTINYTAYAQSIYDNTLNIKDILSATDILASVLGSKITIQPQIAIANSDGVYGAWQNFITGTYNAQYFKARLLVTSSDATVTTLIPQFTFSVDVPDRIDSYQSTTSSTTTTSLTYTSPFNGGNGASSVPTVQTTIVNAASGDVVVLSNVTATGLSLDVYNGGSRVIRTVNIQAQGY